uniref:Myeloid leukemia factor 2 n=1 Tax=Ornithorhynchus anatinus TaxID=9258 RepID=A0A6I8PJM9_ORNAN
RHFRPGLAAARSACAASAAGIEPAPPPPPSPPAARAHARPRSSPLPPRAPAAGWAPEPPRTSAPRGRGPVSPDSGGDGTVLGGGGGCLPAVVFIERSRGAEHCTKRSANLLFEVPAGGVGGSASSPSSLDFLFCLLTFSLPPPPHALSAELRELQDVPIPEGWGARGPHVPDAGAVSPFGMLGMGGFMDMFGMMNDMIGNVEHMTTGANCQTFSSSTVISYSNLGDGAPKVYHETSEMRSAPGGIRETRRTVRDSDSGLEQMSIGHHIRERAHILQRSRNHRTGDQEERQDYINLDESDAAAFDDEWRRETSRFRPQRPLEFRRHEAGGSGGRRAEGPPRLAIQGPEDSPSRQSRRYDW